MGRAGPNIWAMAPSLVVLCWAGPVLIIFWTGQAEQCGPVYDYISPPIVREKQVSNSFLALLNSIYISGGAIYLFSVTGPGSMWASRSGPTPCWAGLGRSKVKYRPVQPIKSLTTIGFHRGKICSSVHELPRNTPLRAVN